jgi:hypothetical protein
MKTKRKILEWVRLPLGTRPPKIEIPKKGKGSYKRRKKHGKAYV